MDSSNYPASALQASYKSPSESKIFTYNLATALPDATASPGSKPGSDTDPEYTKQKTAYLFELRASAKKLQEDINVFLTQKMEEDKAAEASGDKVKGNAAAAQAKEEREEENYGEEILEDDG